MFRFLSVFDLDHTLLTANSSYRFGTYLYRAQFLSKIDLIYCLGYYARHKYLGMSVHSLHDKIFKQLFQGKSQSEIDLYAAHFLEQELKSMISEPISQRLAEAKGSEHYVVILSSSPDFLVKPIAEYLGTHEWQATVYGNDHRGTFTHIISVLDGKDKAAYILELAQRLRILPASVTAYSDSDLDVPMLAIAGRAIGVRPNSKLRRICLKNGWEII